MTKRFIANLLAALLATISSEIYSQETVTLPTVSVTASEIDESEPGSASIAPTGSQSIAGDSARLLKNIPGMSLHGAGGISSLPVLHGLADERLRIQVDGMDPTSSCPNHMNSALSYINPSKIESITVFAGIAPVSVGGDSIGGTVQVNSAPPKFVSAEEAVLITGNIGTFFNSNGKASGNNLGVSWAGEYLNLSYDESNSRSDNYRAGEEFKAAGLGGIIMGDWLNGDVVGSSAYKGSKNRELGIALRDGAHLLRINAGEQQIDFEGFPNQRMDMTGNKNKLFNLRYAGQFDWGKLDTRIFIQNTQHEMDMGVDRFDYGTGMPMSSKASTKGVSLKGDIYITEMSTLRLGTEYLSYKLDDWWPPVGGMMGPDDFWNIRDGERDRIGLFGEWEVYWQENLLGLLGIRRDIVKMDTGDAQGYSTAGIWSVDADAFNALEHQRTDKHWSLTALVRYEPDAMQTYEIGFARKTRSPNLHERYTWSTQAMAALMNNFVGDGNAYVGNLNLKPETAKTFSLTGDWHDAARSKWEFKVTGYFTDVSDFVDARRCDVSAQCGGAANQTDTTGFISLQYVNQSARLYGLDVSGQLALGSDESFGNFTATGMINYVRGKNRTTGDNLYHIMPLNGKFSLIHTLGNFTSTAEVELVDNKKHLSQVRNEVPTDGYGLFNLRTRWEWKQVRINIDIENVFNRFYNPPLGGAYLGQGASMTKGGIPWGVNVPGPGRSVNVALNINF